VRLYHGRAVISETPKPQTTTPSPWRLDWRDLAYAAIGFCLCWYGTRELMAAVGLWLLCLLAYCAGRAVGASHR
jgi:hypothetical protein